MTKPKTLDQLRTEKERAETQLAQEQHKLERLENRKKYLEKGERTKRTHRLCNLGGTIESLAPGGQRSHTHRNGRADVTLCIRSTGKIPYRSLLFIKFQLIYCDEKCLIGYFSI